MGISVVSSKCSILHLSECMWRNGSENGEGCWISLDRRVTQGVWPITDTNLQLSLGASQKCRAFSCQHFTVILLLACDACLVILAERKRVSRDFYIGSVVSNKIIVLLLIKGTWHHFYLVYLSIQTVCQIAYSNFHFANSVIQLAMHLRYNMQ